MSTESLTCCVKKKELVVSFIAPQPFEQCLWSSQIEHPFSLANDKMSDKLREKHFTFLFKVVISSFFY